MYNVDILLSTLVVIFLAFYDCIRRGPICQSCKRLYKGKEYSTFFTFLRISRQECRIQDRATVRHPVWNNLTYGA